MIALGLGVADLRRASCCTGARDIKRLFAYSSIEHMGIIVFAFGMAGPIGNFAGLLQMTMHSLTKSAIFFSVGHVAQVKGTQRIAEIGGLTDEPSGARLGLVAGVAAIAGLPPFGVFMSEFLIVSSTFARAPAAGGARWRSACWSRSARCCCACGSLAFGEPRGPARSGAGLLRADVRASGAGAGRPASICRPPLVAWFQHVAALLG